MKSGAIWMELHALHKHGWTISALAREFGLNWRTVKRELESGEPRRYSERAKPTALTEAQQAHVERRLAVCPTLRGTDLYGELTREYEYSGSYPEPTGGPVPHRCRGPSPGHCPRRGGSATRCNRGATRDNRPRGVHAASPDDGVLRA